MNFFLAEKKSEKTFLFFRYFLGIYGFFAVCRYWYWDSIVKRYTDFSALNPQSIFTQFFLLKLCWGIAAVGFLGFFSKKLYKKSALLTTICFALILLLDPPIFGTQIGLLTLFSLALFLSKNGSTASRYTDFIIKASYISSLGFLGLYRILNVEWTSGRWWDIYVSNANIQGTFYSLFSFSGIKWNFIVLIPLIELSVIFLIKKGHAHRPHFLILLLYHLFVFFILTPRHCPQAIYWIPLLQGICLVFFIPEKDYFIPHILSKSSKTWVPYISKVTRSQFLMPSLIIFVIIQSILPLWPYLFISENINWTHRGDHFAWRMKLNDYRQNTKLIIIDKFSKERITYDIHALNYRTNIFKHTPYSIIYFSHKLKETFAKEGIDVAIYADTYCSLNNRPFYRYIDPSLDLSMVTFNLAGPNLSVLPFPSGIESKNHD